VSEQDVRVIAPARRKRAKKRAATWTCLNAFGVAVLGVLSLGAAPSNAATVSYWSPIGRGDYNGDQYALYSRKDGRLTCVGLTFDPNADGPKLAADLDGHSACGRPPGRGARQDRIAVFGSVGSDTNEYLVGRTAPHMKQLRARSGATLKPAVRLRNDFFVVPYEVERPDRLTARDAPDGLKAACKISWFEDDTAVSSCGVRKDQTA
jgi:hypothetical protein